MKILISWAIFHFYLLYWISLAKEVSTVVTKKDNIYYKVDCNLLIASLFFQPLFFSACLVHSKICRNTVDPQGSPYPKEYLDLFRTVLVCFEFSQIDELIHNLTINAQNGFSSTKLLISSVEINWKKFCLDSRYNKLHFHS